MSTIYIIAGPPGIGKSTRGSDYLSPDLDILNEDDARLRYKEKGFVDYNEYSMHHVRNIIKQKLIRDEDFALELNLGFFHQYEYALSAKQFRDTNKLIVILFFTDSLQLCLNRAKIRYENGLHLVKPETIIQMYQNTIDLFKSNFNKIDEAILINAETNNKFSLVATYKQSQRLLSVYDPYPDWFKNNLFLFIESEISR